MICLSRLYLGMHTVLDIIVGLSLAILMTFPLLSIIDILDYYLVTDNFAVGLMLLLTIGSIVFFPISYKWTPTR